MIMGSAACCYLPGSRPDTLMQSDVVFMLHAPTEIWSSIDRRELLPATRAYLKAKRIAAAATAMQSSDDEVRGAVVGRVARRAQHSCRLRVRGLIRW